MISFLFVLSKCFDIDYVIDVFPISSKSNITYFMRDINKCMQNPLNTSYLPTNTKEAQKHFDEIHSFFESYSNYRRPKYFTCKGPFLENEFIQRFKSKPLSYFSPFIPLFFPWFGVYKNLLRVYGVHMSKILKLLKPEYLYFVLSESDFGFTGKNNFLQSLPSNVFVFSASGMGHVAIPWIQCKQKPLKQQKIEHFLSFSGNPRSCVDRKEILNVVRSVLGTDFYENRTKSWEDVFSKSKFVLSPRGIAVSTYRSYEILRMEVIPVIYTDYIHWLPYFPKLNWSRFSFLTNHQEFTRTAMKLKTLTDDEYNEMKKYLHVVSQKYFQWDGFFNQLDLFFNGGDHSFTCSRAALTFVH